MMLCASLSSTVHSRPIIPQSYKPPLLPPGHAVERILQLNRRKANRRGISVVTRAAPSGSVYIFAFVFPLSLLAITIFTSVRIADKLDQKFMEELALNEAILEAEESDDEEIFILSEEETTPVRTRNRPKREVESSSM